MTTWRHHPPSGVEVDANVPLAPLTTMRVGGAAEYFAKVSTLDALAEVVQWARAEEIPYLVLGGGSNILVSDAGVRGLVIQNRCRQIEISPVEPSQPLNDASTFRVGETNMGRASSDVTPNRVDSDQANRFPAYILKAESGAAMAGAARTSIRNELTGFEWAVSVPGTIGGAVVNNAGAHGGEIKDNLVDALVIDQSGQRQLYTSGQLGYAYRHSILKSKMYPLRASFGPVVLHAQFQLASALIVAVAPAEASAQIPTHTDTVPHRESGTPTDALTENPRAKAEAFLNHRRQTQPVEPSLGSTFMNPPGDYAGRLIESANLKGKWVGKIQISEQHANFIINPEGVGGGSATDVYTMIQQVQQEVYDQFGVWLKPEVQLVGEWEVSSHK